MGDVSAHASMPRLAPLAIAFGKVAAQPVTEVPVFTPPQGISWAETTCAAAVGRDTRQGLASPTDQAGGSAHMAQG
jgi:hypothetical protein